MFPKFPSKKMPFRVVFLPTQKKAGIKIHQVNLGVTKTFGSPWESHSSPGGLWIHCGILWSPVAGHSENTT